MGNLYAQIALLLKTSDFQMQIKGWTSKNTYVFGGLSYTVANPQRWIPRSFSRLYKDRKSLHISAFISVVLGERRKNWNDQEPLLTAGWFDYGIGQQMGNRFNYDWPHWHLNMPQRNDEGRLTSADARTFWSKDKAPFSRVSTLGVPLTSIVDAAGLEKKIIVPLLQGIEEEQQKEIPPRTA